MSGRTERIYARIQDLTGDGKTNPREKTKDVYDQWATEYDQDLTTHGAYTGPVVVADTLADVLGADTEARVLDLGAGTGLCGQQLYKRGYRNIDALDASSDMLRIAKDKDVYSQLICEYLGTNRLPIADASYDGLMLCGTFVPNHANDDCFEEILRILKPGGHFVFAMNEVHLSTPDFKNFERRLTEFVDRGLWRILSRLPIDNYVHYAVQDKPDPGRLTIIQKC